MYQLAEVHGWIYEHHHASNPAHEREADFPIVFRGKYCLPALKGLLCAAPVREYPGLVRSLLSTLVQVTWGLDIAVTCAGGWEHIVSY
jgi:hypothetical protein